MQPLKTPSRVVVALLLVQVFFGLWHVAGAAVLEHVTPAALIGFRVWAGAPLLLLLAWGISREIPERGDLLILAGVAIPGVVVNQLFYAEGLDRAGPVNASILMLTIPVLTSVFAFALRKEAFSVRRVTGLALALLGAAILVDPTSFETQPEKALGNGLILLNASAYALYLVIARPVFSRVGFLPGIAWVFAFGALEITPFVSADVFATDWFGLPLWSKGALAFILIGPTLGAYGLNAYALARTDASTVGAWILLQPIIASFAAWVFLDTALHPHALTGGLVVAAGVLLVTRSQKSVR